MTRKARSRKHDRIPVEVYAGGVYSAALLMLIGACGRGDIEARTQELVFSEVSPAPDPPNMPPRAVLRGIDVYGTDRSARADASVRVVLSFDGAPLFRQRELPAQRPLPARISLELEDTEWSGEIPISQSIERGGLRRVRLATPNPRVVLDLEPGASGRVFYLKEPYRIVVDVTRQGFRSTTRARRRRPVIVLDPGHGGDEPGAVNEEHALVEAELALDLAERTARRLREIMPRAQTLLTRSSDDGVSLEKRCALANAMEADAFVSIHLNASSEPVRKGGVTTFVLDTTHDRQALRLAARENGTRVSAVTGIQGLLAKYHRRGQLAGSRALARRVQRRTLRHGRLVLPELADRGVRRSMFYVLVGASMPAVLIEASFLTHEPEARALKTVAYREALAAGVASGIAGYLRSR